jgi:hypothetical protein
MADFSRLSVLSVILRWLRSWIPLFAKKPLPLPSPAFFSGRIRLLGDHHERAGECFYVECVRACGDDKIAILANLAILKLFGFLIERF